MPRFKTVSNKGKGSRSKPKALKPGHAELQPQPSQISPSDSVEVALDGEDGKKVISNGTEILLEEEKMLSSSVVSGLKENDQNALEDNDLEKEVATELKVDTDKDGTGEGTTDDGEKLSDGDHLTTNLSVEDNEVSTDNLEEDEAPLKFDNNGCSTGDEMEVTTEDVSAHSEALNMTDNFENDKESSKFDADKPVGTISGSEVKVVTGQVSRPMRKVIKKKLVKKKLVQTNAVPHLSDENNASDKACEVDAHEHVNTEEKASYVNYASDKACKADNNEHVSNEEEPEVKTSVTVNKKCNRIRKKKAPQSNSGLATIQDTQNPQSRNDELGTEKRIAINKADVKNNEMEKSVDKASPLKSKKKPKEGKSSKKVDSMGMIFMCSSETKKDCFRYKVLGLPATKKDMVLKIYKGMRLFLFDVDLRMMYGIFKAAGPGGYNIEPRAFKSQFPSQVRFSVLEDSVPLAEERFKKVLKDNYYSKNKFNFQLNHDQVKNLCKLFHEASKKAESTKAASRSQRAAGTSSTARRDYKRKRVDDNRRVSVATSLTSRRDNKRRRGDDSRRVAVARPPPIERERSQRRNHKETRHAPVVVADRYPERLSYERETYVPPVQPVTIYQPLPPLHSPPRSRTYSYDRVLEVDPYRRETVIDSRDLALAPSRGLRLPIERSHYDSYLSYREPLQVYSVRAYDSGARSTHYDYTPSASDRQYAAESEYYRSADYRPPAPPLPLYRRY